MPDADRGLADEVFERLVVAHQLVEFIAFDDYLLDHHAPQPGRAVEQFGDDVGDHLVLGVDDADLAHPLGIARRERVAGRLAQCGADLHPAEPPERVHQPFEVAPIGQEVELDDRLGSPVARSKLDLAGFRKRLVDGSEQRADLLADRMPGGFADANHEHVACRRAADPRGIAQRQKDVPAGQSVEPVVGLDERGDGYRRVVHQPLADAGDMRHDLDPEIAEVTGRPDSGPQQMRGRMDRTRRDDDLATPELGFLAVDERLHADAARPLEQQLLNLGKSGDRQIAAQPGSRIEVADRRRDATVIEVRDRDREIAVLEFAVLVLDVLEPGLFERLGDRLGVAVPQIGEDAANRDAAVLAVPRPVEIHVPFDFFEIGQHGIPVPPCSAARLPLVVIGRGAAVGELAVDRRAAAEHPRLLVFAQWRAVLLRAIVRDHFGVDLELGPVKARVEIGRAGVAVENFRRHLAVRRVLAGFAQQDLVAAFGGEPVRHDRPSRPAADDDVIVGHLPPFRTRLVMRGLDPRIHDFLQM